MENTKTEILIKLQIEGLEIATEGLQKAAENGNVGLMNFYLSMITNYTKAVTRNIEDSRKGRI